MSVSPLTLGVLIPCLALVVALIVFVVNLVRPSSIPISREERTVRWVRFVGLFLGATVGVWVLLEPTPLDRGLGSAAVIAPLCFGTIVMASVLIGEFVVRPRFAVGPRSAALRPRRLRDHLPPRLTRLVATMTVVAGLVSLWGFLTAGPDDLGRAGRSLTAHCSPDITSSNGPYPGSFYLVPYLIGVVVVAAIGLLAALAISRRALGAKPGSADRYRRAGLTTVLSAYGLTLSVPLVGIAFFAATALLSNECPQRGWTAAGIVLIGVAFAAVGTMIVSLVGLIVPTALGTTDVHHGAERTNSHV